jgi:uncharacterized protein (TIGR03067 family)
MKAVIGLFACFMLIGAEEKDKKATDPLVGVWKVTSLVAAGQEREQAKGTLYTFKDGKLVQKGARGERNFTYKLDASKKPAELDMTSVGGQRNGAVTKAIYEVKGDDLKISFIFMQEDRPKDFGSEGTQVLVTLKKETGDKADSKEKKP